MSESKLKYRREKCKQDFEHYEKILVEEHEEFDKWERCAGFDSAWRLQQARMERVIDLAEEMFIALHAIDDCTENCTELANNAIKKFSQWKRFGSISVDVGCEPPAIPKE